MSFLNRSDVILVGASTVILIFVIVITAAVQGSSSQTFSQIILVGPLWTTDAWTCTSDADFMIYGTLRTPDVGSQISINISSGGTQSLFTLDQGKLETFSVGSPPGTVIITRTGTVTGFITMQTTSIATASCFQS